MGVQNHPPTWTRSRYCSDGACAEVAVGDDAVHLRNSDRPEEVVTLTPAEWEALKQGIRDGQF